MLRDTNWPYFSIQGGDGWKGLPDKGPFDAIHVGAAAEGTKIEKNMECTNMAIFASRIASSAGRSAEKRRMHDYSTRERVSRVI